MWSLAVLSAFAHVGGALVAAALMALAGVFPEENVPPGEQGGNDWLATMAAPALLALALAMLVALVLRRPWLAAGFLVGEAIVAAPALWYGFGASVHSDTALYLFTLAVAAPAVLAVWLGIASGWDRHAAA